MPFDSSSFYKNIEEDWQQGDILLDVNFSGQKIDLATLITPQCDIVQNNADYFLFVLTTDFSRSFRKIIDPNYKLSNDHMMGLVELTKSKLTDIISNIIHHFNGIYANRFYYLPPNNEIGEKFDLNYLDFQKILTVPKEVIDDWKEKRTVTITDPFRAQILSRYIAYIGRIGTPDYTEEEIHRLIDFAKLQFKEEDFKGICNKKLGS